MALRSIHGWHCANNSAQSPDSASDLERLRASLPATVGNSAGAFGETLLAGTPLGRFGEPEDIAPLAVFLASEDSHWVPGESIRASGAFPRWVTDMTDQAFWPTRACARLKVFCHAKLCSLHVSEVEICLGFHDGI